jgi:hypothetical protein
VKRKQGAKRKPEAIRFERLRGESRKRKHLKDYEEEAGNKGI